MQEKHHGGLCAQLCPLCPPHQEARLPPFPQTSSGSLQQCSSLRPLPNVQPPAHGRTSPLAPVSHHAAGGCRQSPPRGSPAPCHNQGTAPSGAGVQLEEETAPGRASCAFIEGSPAMGTVRAMGVGGRRGSGGTAQGCRGTAGPGGSLLVAPLLGGVLADEGVPLAAGVVLPRHETCERREQSERWGGQRGCAGRALLRVGGSRSSLGPAVPRAGAVPLSTPHGTSSVPAHPRSPPAPCSISPWGARRRPRRSSASWSRLSTPGLGSGPREEGGWR